MASSKGAGPSRGPPKIIVPEDISPHPQQAANPNPINTNSLNPVSSSTRTLRKISGIQISGTGRSTHDTRSMGEASLANQTRVTELQNYVVNKIELIKKNQASLKKLTQLASFIPDFILKEDSTKKTPYQNSSDAVVFMVDVSGFTALTEAYSLKGKGGTDQLTKTLMGYIGPLAECILRAEGDIVKYAGDAFLAFWITNPDDYQEDVQRAVDCALYIQEKYGSYLCKEVDITIRVKIGIGAGLTHFCGIGNENYQHYVCFGPGVEGASDGEKHCTSGEVVLHGSAWAYCHPTNYKATVRDSTFRVVTQILNFLNPEKRGRPLKSPQHNNRGDARRGSLQASGMEDIVRPTISEGIENKAEEFMRKFIIPPVLRKVDDDIPLEYLSESRVVCICFIHIETTPMSHDGVPYRENMIQIVNKCFNKVYTGVTKMQGALTKVIMFDKGLTYLVVFGLPGYINEHQCTHALKFSHACRRSLLGIRGVEEVSIGVTTGSCWSGVLGHLRRQEYTVMGRKVNKAARLMCYYPARVTCDQDTAYHSKLPSENFQLQEYKELKGIANPGKIFEFVNAETQEDNSIATFQYPMVGREAELRFFKEVISKTQKELSDHIRMMSIAKGTTLMKETVVSKGIWVIAFEGENGIGKSRMLAACIDEAEKLNVQVFSVGMNLVSTGSLFGISSLVMDAVGIGGFRTTQEREDYIRKKVQEQDLAAELCLVNDILHTKFPLNPKYANIDSLATQTYAQHVLSALLAVFCPDNLVIFAVDDAQFLDVPSWEHILALAKNPHIFCLLTIRRNSTGIAKIPESVANQIYHNKNIKVVRLNGLDPSYCKTLACQIMEVSAIPADLEKILMAKSQGVPAWCDQVLHELVRTGVLKYSATAKKTMTMVYCDKPMLQKLSNAETKRNKTQKMWASDDEYAVTASQMTLNPHESTAVLHRDSVSGITSGAEDIDPSKRLLVVKSGTNIGHIQLHGTLHEILLDSYDELNSNEQIILKCASVCGRKFSRLMTTRILPTFQMNAKKYEAGFNHLMEARYIRCASGVHTKKDQSALPDCFCKESFHDSSSRTSQGMVKRPKYWSCKYMEFVKDTLAEVVYDLMTEDQRKEFHLKAAKYLDYGAAKCESCGGHNSAFEYGIVLKGTELGTMDNEESLRAAANARRKTDGQIPGLSFNQIKREGRTRASFTTQIAGMKKRFQNDGSKIAQIEFEILSLLRKIDMQEKKYKCCTSSKWDEDAEKELNEELKLLRDAEDNTYVNLKPSLEPGGPEGGDNNLATDPNDPTSERETRNSLDAVDLRLCECEAIQAKICIEKVKHYRESKKYGKCLVNLLDAAEHIITIGNGNQGLIHLEDAAGLLKSIKSGQIEHPDKDDPDDVKYEETEIEGQMEYLNGLAYFELGVYAISRDYFINSLARLGLKLNIDNDNKTVKRSTLIQAKTRLWATRYLYCCGGGTSSSKPEDMMWLKRLRILSYLHSIFKRDKKLEMALLVSIWEVITAERYGDIMHDVIPAYCNKMATHTAMAHHNEAKRYEKLSLDIIRDSFDKNEELDPAGLLTTAGLFQAITYSRLCRGSISQAAEAAYLGLRIAQAVHDNSSMVRLLPSLVMTLMMGLRIPELIQALQKLWYIADEEDDWAASAIYYALCLDLLLRTAYPLETFNSCENFVTNHDWQAQGNLFRDFEVLFTIEASLALWYARYNKWELSTKWLTAAETHRPKLSTFLSVSAELKLLECQLIFVNHYLDCKRYQHFAKARNASKELMRSLTKSTKVAPVLKPRFLHLMAYYYKIRSRNVEAEKNLRHAEKLANAMNNELETQWIIHNRTVWNDMAIPTIKFFWLEHTENHVLDWHTSGKIPWANIMYSLPLPAWK